MINTVARCNSLRIGRQEKEVVRMILPAWGLTVLGKVSL